MNNLPDLSNMVASFVVTYLLHSTILLTACWIALGILAVSSQFLIERLWKLAAVLGLLTAACQVATRDHSFFELPELPVLGTLSGDGENETLAPRPRSQSAPVADFVRQPEPAGSFSDTAEIEGESKLAVDEHDQLPQASIPAGSPAREIIGRRTASYEDQRAGLNEGSRDSQAIRRGTSIHQDSNRLSRLLAPIAPAISLAATIVIAVGALVVLGKSLRLRRKCLGARVLHDGPARAELDGFLKRNRIRISVQLLTSSRYAEPFTYRLFGWNIVLPEGIDKRLSREELAALLAHEVAHLVRGDATWMWMGQLLCTSLAFQPLNWLARRRWQQAAEYVCDDWAVQRGVSAMSLAKCLARIAEWRLGNRLSPLGLAAGGTKTTLVQRVERLMQNRRPIDGWASPLRRSVMNLFVVTCCAVVVVFVPRVAVAFPPDAQDFLRTSRPHAFVADSPEGEQTEQRWETLCRELRLLETDLEQAASLLKNTERYSVVEPLMDDIRRRTALLQARRIRISQYLGKESE